jgi:hypothetical protein
MQDDGAVDVPYRVLHAIVGHQFPVYFINAVKSVLLMTGNDDIIVVDNASNLPRLTLELQSIADKESRVHLLLRETNDISRNSKVGGLYDAYNEVVSYALRQGYDYLHIMQNDMQMLWWDESIMRRAREIYTEYPQCVNISMLVLPFFTLTLGDNLEYIKPKLAFLRDYGLTDTGLYDLERWRRLDMRFLDSETGHAKKYLSQGLCVFRHPLPTVAPIPWPAVVRSGRVKGREVQSSQQFLLQPLNPSQISQVKEATEPVCLENVGIPWGWTCLTPYWATDLRRVDYWVYWYRAVRRRGLRAAWPRWERRGLATGTSLRRVQRRPRFGLLPIVFQPIWYSTRRTLEPRLVASWTRLTTPGKLSQTLTALKMLRISDSLRVSQDRTE